MAASVIFWDFGITDAITDKHRTYQGNLVIPVARENGNAAAGAVGEALEKTAVEPSASSAGDG